MAKQKFWQPPKRRRDLDAEQPSDFNEPLVTGASARARAQETSSRAQDTLDNIDDVLGQETQPSSTPWDGGANDDGHGLPPEGGGGAPGSADDTGSEDADDEDNEAPLGGRSSAGGEGQGGDDDFFRPYDESDPENLAAGPGVSPEHQEFLDTHREEVRGRQKARAEAQAKAEAKRQAKFDKIMSGKSNTRKRWAIAGVLGGGSAIVAVIAFLALLPLKVQNLVQNLESKFGATTNHAIERESDNLLAGFVRRDIVPALNKGRCHSTIEPGCVVIDDDTGPVGKLYKAWGKTRFENKLATQYGMVFGKKGSTYYMNLNGTNVDITKLANGHADFFSLPSTKEMSQAEILQNIHTKMQDSTLWQKVYMRYKFNPYLKSLGIHLCFNYCQSKLGKKFTNTTQAIRARSLDFKLFFIQNILEPYSDNMALVMTCVVQGCSSDDLPQAKTGEPERVSPLRQELRDKLRAWGAAHGTADLTKLAGLSDQIGKKGFSKAIIDRSINNLIDKITGKEAAQSAENEVPVAGWVLFAAKVIRASTGVGPEVRTIEYTANTEAAATTFSAVETIAAQQRSGRIDPTDLESLGESLGSNVSGTAEDRVDMTGAPLQHYIMNDEGPQENGFSNGATKGKVTGHPQDPNGYKCNDGNPVPAGKLVCSEEEFGRGLGFLDAIAAPFKAIPGLTAVAGFIVTLGNIPGNVLAGALEKFCGTPVVGKPCKLAEGAIGKITGKLLSWVSDQLIKPLFSGNISGARLFDIVAAGADWTFNTTCRVVLGCGKLSNAQVAQQRQEQADQIKDQFNTMSVTARIFSTKTPYSLVSRMAMVMPTNMATTANGIFSTLLKNPLSVFSTAFSSIFSTNHAFAATPVIADPFNIPQSGYTNIPSDPQAYWATNCVNGPMAFYDETTGKLDVSDWLNQNQEQDEQTGDVVNTSENPCLLIQATVESLGATSDGSLVPADEQNNDGTNEAATTTVNADSGAYQNPLRDVKNLGPQRIDQGVDYSGSGPVYAIGNGVIKNITNSGWPGGTFIVYRLSDGPAQGKYVFFAENCTPIKVHVGQTVDANTVLCDMVDASPHIETGWAEACKANNCGYAAAHAVWVGHDSSSYYTAYGKNFSDLLVSLGAPAGTIQNGAVELGTLPNGWPAWQ